jgi:hypothetical protein
MEYPVIVVLHKITNNVCFVVYLSTLSQLHWYYFTARNVRMIVNDELGRI